jgi:cyclomaltodextrinase
VLDYADGARASAVYPNLELMREAYPPQAFYAQMNLLSTHDQARSLHHFGWSAEHGNLADAGAEALAKQKLRLALLFQMSFPGAPTVYYGDEVGVTGGDDPYNRGTYPWADRGGRPDNALLADFKQLIKLRNTHAVLRRGSINAPLFLDEHVVVLARQLGERWAITATNNADSPRQVRVVLPTGAPARWADALAGNQPLRAEGGALVLDLPARYGRVLIGP